jgi:ABC-type sugar transport system permease subunit
MFTTIYIVIYVVITYFVIGLLYALTLNAKPIDQKPLWTSSTDPLKRLFAILIWMTTWPLAFVKNKNNK